MSPKQNPKSRRKNLAPKRVVREDPEEKIFNSLRQDPEELAKFIAEQPITNFYKPPAPPDVFYEILKKVREESIKGQEILYCCPTCFKKNYRSPPGLKYHFMHDCPAFPPFFTCLICEKTLDDNDKMIEHIQDDHVYLYLGTPTAEAARRRSFRQSSLKIQMFAESSVAAEELERSYSSMSDGEEVPPEFSLPTKKESKRRATPKDPTVVPRLPKQIYGGSYTSVQAPLAEAFQWTHQRREVLERRFPLAHPHIQHDFTTWKEVERTELFETFSMHKQSPAFAVENKFLNMLRTGKRNTKNVITSKPNGGGSKFGRTSADGDRTYHRLELFDSVQTSNDFSTTFYAGGPIWGCAWCPQSCCREAENQVLAVCCHFGEHSLEPQNLFHDPVLLQIWDCGELPNRPPSRFQVKPQLSYALAVDAGPIWGLKWCPLADSVLNLSPKHQRIGVIALACAAGDVRIYALPKPGSGESPSKGTIYRAPPHTVLRPLRSGHLGQCTCVAWSVDDGCHLVVAGFASGHIALWDVTTTSKLTCKEEEGVRVIYAFHTFRGHSKPLEDIVFCPFDSNYFVSVAADRFLKIWDRRNTDADLPNFLPPKMSIIYELEWPSSWCGVYASSDSAFSIPYFHGAIFLNLGSSANTLQNVVPQKSASWSVTSSDWLNCVASGDVAGNVILNICNNWNRQFISNKNYPRIALFQTEVEWNQESAASSYVTGESADQFAYNLVFHDCNLIRSMDKWRDSEAHLKVRTFEDFDDESYDLPVGAIQKVRWNPNRNSFTWIASATHSGLLRLHCVPGLVSADVELFWAASREKS